MKVENDVISNLRAGTLFIVELLAYFESQEIDAVLLSVLQKKLHGFWGKIKKKNFFRIELGSSNLSFFHYILRIKERKKFTCLSKIIHFTKSFW